LERTISAFEARRSFGKVLDDVVVRGDRLIVERHGSPVAAVVPIAEYARWKRDRDAFFDRLEEIAGRAGMPPDAAEKLVGAAIEDVRKQAT
jgi:prevent-host-death family protein